ncbi:TetR/AcrR family transcriptional regulator [Nocardiopsis exhalans]|uniref:TetR/AcrR family transcriptional regulator n=1 Tax=Nocardiopsis exhalans TaxID=163604 RepID=A0ABY5DGR6_9ACTN|nr:TetR/AcrR family transcriptional regulator [Nocardiopsis exhalans]USY22286.1 TetR/AcrR family transcriptional regulator [Nocardiopsis exhalans]
MAEQAKLRRDAVRNRQRILDAGRGFVQDGHPLQLNEVSRAAKLGVATVYRHFPSPEALLEALARPGIEQLLAEGRNALATPDHWAALRGFLRAGLRAQLADPTLQPVFSSPEPVTEETTELCAELDETLATLLGRAKADGLIAPDMQPGDVLPLMCGIAHAVRLRTEGNSDDVHGTIDRYLDTLLTGLRAHL